MPIINDKIYYSPAPPLPATALGPALLLPPPPRLPLWVLPYSPLHT